MSETKPCAFCGKFLESVSNNWETMQPDGGGEMRFIFSYGSEKFDLEFGTTTFQGVICDDCAEKCMSGMERLYP